MLARHVEDEQIGCLFSLVVARFEMDFDADGAKAFDDPARRVIAAAERTFIVAISSVCRWY